MKKKEMESSYVRVEKLKKEGFSKDFVIRDGFLIFEGSLIGYSPEAVKIVSHYRFEGISDPADNSIVYAIETYDGIKGVLTDAYGVYADGKTSKFIHDVEQIAKKETSKKPPTPSKGSAKTDE